MALEKLENEETLRRALRYSKSVCDNGIQVGCGYSGRGYYTLASNLHQRILKASMGGDPKGIWRYKSDLNKAIEEARQLYTTAKEADASLNNDW